MKLREWVEKAPEGSWAAGLIELWRRRGQDLEREATRDQALILAPLLESAKTDPCRYEIVNNRLVRRPLQKS